MDQERLSTIASRGRGLRMAAVLAVGTGLALSACGGSSKQSPASAVDSAVSQLGSSSSLGVRVSLGITAQQAQQIATRNGKSLSTQQADAVSTGSIFFYAQTGHGEAIDSNQAVTDSANAYDLGLQFGTAPPPLEIRYVDGNLYALADVSQLLTDVGQSPARGATFQKDLASLNGIIPGISTLGTSQWVEVSHESLTSLGALLKQAGGFNAAQIQSEMAQLRTAAVDSLKSNSTTTSVGPSGGRSEYRTTVDLHGFVTSFGQTAQKDLSGLPVIGPRISSAFGQLGAKVPAGRTATAEIYTSTATGKLSEVDVDLQQFAPKLGTAVPLKVAFSAPPAVSAPTGATTLDLSQLPSLLQHLIAGHLGQPSGTAGTTQ